jgi:hypothetical protein
MPRASPSPAVAAQPDPEPAVPEPEVEAKAPAPHENRSPAPRQKPSCDDRRSNAASARASSHWSMVLTHTKDKTCWANATVKRDRLRVEALMKLGRYKACAMEAPDTKDPTVSAWKKDCFRRSALGPAEGGVP